MRLWETVDDLEQAADRIRARRYGVIQVVEGRLRAVRLRPWPSHASWLDVGWLGKLSQWRRMSDQCWLYYNQPRCGSNFLTLKYIVTSPSTSLRTFRGALLVLDEVARLKGTDAIVADVANQRVSDRLLIRWGWEAHCLHRSGRHFIKRFYGDYPPRDPAWTELAGTEGTGPAWSELARQPINV